MKISEAKHPPLAAVIIAFAIIYIVWGSTYFFIQLSEEDFPPFLLGAIRFLASGIILLAWCAFKKYKLIDKTQLKTSFIVGNLLLFLGNGSVIWAETTLPSSFVAVLVSAAPLWIVLFDARNRRSNFANKHVIIGVITGFAGVILLFGEKIFPHFGNEGASLRWIPLLVIVIGNISWSVGSLYSKYNATGNTMVGASWQMIFASLTFIAVALFTGEVTHFDAGKVQLSPWLSIIYLITMGSLAGYSAYIWLLEVKPATQVSTNAYVNPVVAVLLGAFFAGELISGLQIGALAAILLSVFIINFEKYKNVRTRRNIRKAQSVEDAL